MIPLRLTIEGINSFIREQSIDFETLSGDGLFGIFGPTAAGKSTIIDAITLALYGKIARFEGQHKYRFMNSDAAKTRVVFEFEAQEQGVMRKFLIRKSYETKKSGPELYEKTISRFNGEYVPLGIEKEDGITEFVTELLGLSFDDFVRSVILPQGKFTEFLFLENKERSNMLERIFRLEEFGERLSKKVAGRATEVSARLKELQERFGTFKDISPEGLKLLENELETQAVAADRLSLRLAGLNRDLKEAGTKLEDSKELEGYENEYKLLTGRKAETEQKRLRLSEGIKAAALGEYFERAEAIAAERKEAEHEKAQKTEKFAVTDACAKEASLRYEAAFSEKEKAYPGLLERETKLKSSVELYKELALIKAENEKLKIEGKNILAALNDTEEKISSLDNDVQKNTEIMNNFVAKKPDYEKILLGRDDVYLGYEAEKKLLALKSDAEETEKKLGLSEKELDTKKNELEKKTAVCLETDSKLSETLKILEGLSENTESERDLTALKLENSKAENELETLRSASEDYSGRLKEFENHEAQIKRLKIELTAKKSEELKLEDVLMKTNDGIIAFKDNNIISLLAEKLEAGKACPVCGSTEHPKPAKKLTDEIIGALEEDREKTESALSALRTEIFELEKRLNSEEALRGKCSETVKRLLEQINGRDCDAESERLRQRIDEAEKLEKKISEQIRLKKEAEDKRERLAQELNSAKIAETKLSAELNASVEKQREALEKSDKIKLDLSGLTATLEGFKRKLETEMSFEELYNRIKQTSEELDKINKKEESFKAYLTGVRSEKDTLMAKLSDEKSENSKLAAKISEKTASIASIGAKILAVTDKDPETELEKTSLEIKRLSDNEKAAEQEYNKAKEEATELKNELISLSARLEARKSEGDNANAILRDKLAEAGFESEERAKACLITEAETAELQTEIRAYDNLTAKLTGLMYGLERKLENVDRTQLAKTHAELTALQNELNGEQQVLAEKKGTLKAEISEYNKKLSEAARLNEDMQKTSVADDMLTELKQLFRGNKFINFIAEHKLRQITFEAGNRLKTVTNGRYALELENVDFFIRDDFNGGVRRSPKTLSGGESFIVSLCLALALSSNIRGKNPGDFFFLDEGFGTLDSSTLSDVADTLAELTQSQITVGLISHVEELKERIPRRITVIPAAVGGDGASIVQE